MGPAVKIYFAVSLFLFIVNCMKIVPERALVTYADKNEVEQAKVSVSRHGRKSGYLINIEGIVLKPWYNNVTIDLVFYEYLHNEYRRSFVEMHFKICDFIEKEAYIGKMLQNTGLSCPVFGAYHMMNMTVPTENFPYVEPFQKFRVDFNISTKMNTMVTAYIYAHITKK